MADITKCANGETCPLRLKCRRYLVKPAFRQSWFISEHPGPNCPDYLPLNPSDEARD